MLVEAISRTSGAQSYQFSQLSELLDCLMVSGSRAEGARAGTPLPQSSTSQEAPLEKRRDSQVSKPFTGLPPGKHIHVPHLTWSVH